ncbi:MAG TPA: transmembrane 220 family protein [Gammaproteobacteria bacterium]
MKILFDLAAFLLLAIAMVLQFNDPDPWFWASFYFICSLIPLLAVFKVYNKVLYWLGVAFCVAAIVLTFNGGMEYLRHTEESLLQGMSADKPYIEETRELLGTLIALAIISVYPFRKLAKNHF